MKTLTILLLLISGGIYGQSEKIKRDYKKKPLSDTAYVYIEGKYKKKGGVMEIWQQDLQTGERWFSTCPRNRKFPKGGAILRMLRSKQEFID